MNNLRMYLPAALAALLVLGGCATRPVNPPITHVDPNAGYTFQTRQKHFKSQENLVVLAFSGGGTRAAAFSYGVLEFLRRTDVVAPNGNKVRLLDAVDVIAGPAITLFRPGSRCLQNPRIRRGLRRARSAR